MTVLERVLCDFIFWKERFVTCSIASFTWLFWHVDLTLICCKHIKERAMCYIGGKNLEEKLWQKPRHYKEMSQLGFEPPAPRTWDRTLTIEWLKLAQNLPFFHLATSLARRRAKTRIRQRDWLAKKFAANNWEPFPLFSVRANKFAKWKTGFSFNVYWLSK